jgi:hypothetical protein
MSMFSKNAVTYDQLIDMIKAMERCKQDRLYPCRRVPGWFVGDLCVCERRGGSVREGIVLRHKKRKKS